MLFRKVLLFIPLVVKAPKMPTGATNAPYLFCFIHASFGLVWFPPTLWTAVNRGCIQSYIVATHYFYYYYYFFAFWWILCCDSQHCLSFSPSTIIFHLPTYHVRAGWEVGACRTNWRVDRMTDMVRNFFISPCRGFMFIFCLHVAMWIKTPFCKQWQRLLPWILGGFHSHCCWRNSTAANHCAYKERKHSVLTLGCYFYR